ncbi:hypothetical protein BDQ12DRAFT_682787 [Crucibulum laeve]|uniref:RING-type domain-containing protein n=1 Tax=Crucibulum laeve TaxID=68775 RepID=A0A5C3M0Q7_9AGAR|nr:hypothetical protein BDQ12DRAFT_682787 [Crucibulum laeve]
MGQSSSKSQRAQESSFASRRPSPPVDSSVNADVTADSVETRAGTTTEAQIEVPRSRSRRTSIRKSILNFVKPGSRTRVSSAPTAPNISTRKSWRDSRRWSKAPPDLHPPESFSSNAAAGPSNPPSPSAAAISEKGKEPERENPSPAPPSIMADRPSTPFPPTLAETASSSSTHDVSQNIGAWLSGQSSIADTTPHDEIEIGSVQQDEVPTIVEPVVEPEPHVEPQPQPQPQAQPAPAPTPAAPSRQFPPPGTLVVVQGIVHTTDVARPNPTPVPIPAPVSTSLSTETDATPRTPTNAFATLSSRASSTPPATSIERSGSSGRTRNRLSALLRSRPSSAVIPDTTPTGSPALGPSPLSSETLEPSAIPASDTPHSISDSESTDDTSNTGITTPSAEPESVHDPAAASSADPNANNEDMNDTPALPSISSNSIDVLGTLLSVAAAATAASLLTGSSEPILSSGLAHSAAANRPVPGPNLNDMSAAGRAERMRQAWSAIRERLGLRSNPATTSPNEGNPTRQLQDTRELMLQEMARAFNVGLGLGGNVAPTPGAPNSAANVTDPAVEEPAVLPEEGSFERFLVDLQTDLRTALSPEQQESPSNDDSTANEATPGADNDGDTSYGDAPILHDDLFVPSQSEDTQPPPQLLAQDQDVAPVHSHGSDDEMPNLQDVSDSSDDDTESEQSEADAAAPLEPASIQPGPSTNVTNRIDASGRINWWRLYRFPAIAAPRAPTSPVSPGTSAPTATPFGNIYPTTNIPAQDLPITEPSEPASPTMPPLEALPQSTQPAAAGNEVPTPTPAPADAPPANTVIPVIVVGLQSVNAWGPEGLAGDDPAALFGADPADFEDAEGDAFGNQNNQGTPGRGRARGWQSRAANAIRNLRPGRRRGVPQLGGGPASRTFLIYVIGGYYPPDHTIVTGGPNSFESFEALLELAEILGQVKAPTVSKEEIEKSGLEIIKPAQLEQHEKSGKIASNCVDRCLICLDDYDPEDDIRVMTCRHGFHKVCVDKWLETGRNNCPACRSTGVSTGSPSHIPTTNEA